MLSVLFSVRGEWKLLEGISCNRLVSFFICHSIDAAVCNRLLVSKNPGRLIEGMTVTG